MEKIITIGGGTGSFTILRALKLQPFDISAIVTMFDSGGSSGVLRDEYGILPPGDVRRCLVALADEELSPVLRDLFNYRFNKVGSLNGHNFGNLFLTALTQISKSYAEAVDRAALILNCKGRIIPVSLDNAHLCAVLENGQVIAGEANIDVPKHDPRLEISRMYLSPGATLSASAQEAIVTADAIIFCPGDLYTSLIPNLLVEGMAEALKESKARKVYICNLMTKSGETSGFKASRFAKEVLKYSGLARFDYLICNNVTPSPEQLAPYHREGQFEVKIDPEVYATALHVIEADLMKEADLVRHDSDKINTIISTLI